MRLAVGVLLVAVFARPGWPWGCAAHQVVAEIAERLAGERARGEATALLEAHPIDPALRRSCRRPGDAFVDAAMWADDVRGLRPATAPWHYVDVPLGATGLDGACPPAGCVTRAIETELAVLRSGAPGARRAEALRWLVHLVADLHQPLHAATNGDKGGNCTPVAYLDGEVGLDRHTRKYTPNLHAVWDARLVEDLLAREGRGTTPAGLATRLRAELASAIPGWLAARAAPAAWAWETHRVAVDVAYGRLRPVPPVEPPVHVTDCRENRKVGARMRALGLRIDRAYVDAALPAVAGQLARAGARLAGLLDATWPGGPPAGTRETPRPETGRGVHGASVEEGR